MATPREELVVQNEYKHLRITLKDKFILGAHVNNAKVEYDGENKMRITATLEGHKIIDTGWVYIQEGYSYEIVEDETVHQLKLRLSDIKVAYRLALQAGNDTSLSERDKAIVLRLIVIFGNFVKRAMK